MEILKVENLCKLYGKGENKVEEVCSKVQKGFAVPVNFNCPGQIVISGDKDGIKEAENIAKQYGARRVIELKTSGPFHTIKLQKASDELRKELDKIKQEHPDYIYYESPIEKINSLKIIDSSTRYGYYILAI